MIFFLFWPSLRKHHGLVHPFKCSVSLNHLNQRFSKGFQQLSPIGADLIAAMIAIVDVVVLTYTHYVLHTWHSKSLIIGMTKVQKKFPVLIAKKKITFLLYWDYCEDLLEEKSRKSYYMQYFSSILYCKNHVNRVPDNQGAAVV